MPPQELRALLHGSLRSAEGADVFALLFASWSHSCAASLALALLAQVGGEMRDAEPALSLWGGTGDSPMLVG